MNDLCSVKMRRNQDGIEFSVVIDSPFRGENRLQAKSGNVAPKDYVQQLLIYKDGLELVDFQFSQFMKERPTIVFTLKNAAKGQVLSLRWLTSLGKNGEQKVIVSV